MELNEYQQHVLRTAPRTLDAYPEVVQEAIRALVEAGEYGTAEDLRKLQDIHIWAHGLAGEAGEVCDLLKKTHGHGKPYDADKMLKELGDVIWYVAVLAHAHGFTLDQVAQANVDKLKARYPKGFSVAAAAAKADETPRMPKAEPGGCRSSCGCDTLPRSPFDPA